NIKGGVGKSTLCMFLYEMLREKLPQYKTHLIDTDPQMTSSTVLRQMMPSNEIRQLPTGDHFDGVGISSLDGLIKNTLIDEDNIIFIDSGAGRLGSMMQVVKLTNVIIVPTSLSWTDLRPTLEFIHNIDEHKQDYGITNPHIIVVPNRISPNQRDYSILNDFVKDINVIIAPPVSDYAIVRNKSHGYKGISDIAGSKFHSELDRLANFLISHVISGELDRIYGS
ncbi:MAG: ParA family protein, partial [Candidatus Puniceispirillales bacterium]